MNRLTLRCRVRTVGTKVEPWTDKKRGSSRKVPRNSAPSRTCLSKANGRLVRVVAELFLLKAFSMSSPLSHCLNLLALLYSQPALFFLFRAGGSEYAVSKGG